MHHFTVYVYLSTALLTYKLAVCDWTFSLRISSAVCCNSATCEQVGTCDSLFVALCFRDPNRIREDRVSCRLIAGDGQNITGRELTPSSFVTGSLEPAGITRQDTAYLGGFQIYAAVLTMVDIPPYTDGNIIDELFIEVVSIAGGGESSMMAYGENGRVNVSLSAISVQCIEGFSGDDCETVNTCNEQITCNETLGYCNTDGECICFDGNTECATVIETPSRPATVTATPSSDSDPVPTTVTATPSSDSDPVPTIVGVIVAALVLLAVIICVIVVILCYSRNKRRKAAEMTVLTGPLDGISTANSTSGTSPAVPLYSTVNKDKKRRVPPPTPAPYQIPVTDIESSDVRVEDVAYGTTLHRQSLEESDEVPNKEATVRNGQGLVYADLDLHAKRAPPKPKRPVDTLPLPATDPSEQVTDPHAVAYTIVNPYSKPRTPPQVATGSGEVAYYSVAK